MSHILGNMKKHKKFRYISAISVLKTILSRLKKKKLQIMFPAFLF